MLDYFRGRRPWPQFWRYTIGLPEHGRYKSALAMNPEIGAERAKQPLPDEFPPPTPYGYSLSILLQLRQIDLLKELMRVIPASFSGKLPPPMQPEPRPMTAEMRIRDEQETKNVYDALVALNVQM